MKLLPKTRSDIVGVGGAAWLALPSVYFPDLTTSSIFFWEFTNPSLTENCLYRQTFQETPVGASIEVKVNFEGWDISGFFRTILIIRMELST